MMLYVLRHGEAEAASENGEDAARRLTSRGRDRMRAAAVGMRALKLRFDAIVTSPLVRAAETAEIVAVCCGCSDPPHVLDALSGVTPPNELASALAPFAHNENVLVVGHEPQLGSLVSVLLTGSANGFHVKLKRGGCVALELPNHFERGGAELRWMMTQRQLRHLRK